MGINHRKLQFNNRILRIAGIYALIIITTLIGVRLLLGDYPPPEHAGRMNARNTLYILLSQPRSGSSWVGSFFDAHNEVFYVYEPFHPKAYENADRHLTKEIMQTEILKSLCTCEFSNNAPAHGLHHKSKAIDRAKGLIKSIPPDPERMSRECKASRYTVAKVLQLANPGIISAVSEFAECDIHIAHLIRDPRPSIFSRMNTFKRIFAEEQEISQFTEPMVRDSAGLVCSQMMERVEILSKDPTYNFFKFEELKRSPLLSAKFLFKGLDIPWNEEVERQVHESSSGSSQGGGFDIIKDSVNVGRTWKDEMPTDFRKAVEESCDKMMKYFNYRPLLGFELNIKTVQNKNE